MRIRYSLIITALLLACACQEKEGGGEKDTPKDEVNLSITAKAPEDYAWSKDSEIEAYLISSTGFLHQSLKNTSAQTVDPVFSGKLSLKDPHYTLYGISPASSYVAALSGTRVKFSLPDEQTSQKSSPDVKADILVSDPNEFDKTAETSVECSFSRASSVLKLIPSGFSTETVISVTLEFQNTMVAGVVPVNLADRSIGSYVGTGSKRLSVKAYDRCLMNGKNAVFAGIWPSAFKTGETLTVKLKTDKRNYIKTLVAGTDFKASAAAGETVEILCPLTEDNAVLTVDLRVMSFNVKAGTDGDTAEHNWTSRKVGQKLMVEKWSPDIIAIQEADVAQRKYYSALAGYSFVTVTDVPQSGSDYKQSGLNEIAYKTSRFKLLKSGWYWLSETPDKVSLGYDYDSYLTAVYAKFEDVENGQELYVVCTHLAASGNNTSRKFTSNLVVERTKELCSDKDVVFVMGDMNAADYTGTSVSGYPEKRESISAFFNWMSNARSTATTKVGDYSLNHWGEWTKHETLNIDMIFYRNIKSADCFTTDTDSYNNTEYISDHYPVIFDCKY